MFRLIQTTETIITPPAVQALTLEYVKTHLRSLGDADDVLVRVWVDAAASYFIEKTGRPLITERREFWLERFPSYRPGPYASWGGGWQIETIELPHPPLQRVVSVMYLDSTNTLVPFSDGASPETLYWQFGAPQGQYARRGWVRPIPGQSWPIAMPDPAAVRIQYDCGYGDSPEDIPELARGILCYLIASFDQNRSPEAFRSGFGDFPLGLEFIIDGFKKTALPSQVLRHPGVPYGMYGGWEGGYPW